MKKLLLTLLVALPFNTYADMTCAGGFCHGVPSYMLVWPHGGITVFPLSNDKIAGLTCTASNDGRALSLPDSVGQDKIYAVLLAAITAQKSVSIRLPDSKDNCVIQYIKFSA